MNNNLTYKELKDRIAELEKQNEFLKLSEKQDKISDAKYRKMIGNIGDVIVIIDSKGLNKYKSPNIEKYFGWKPEDVIGKNALGNIHPEDLEFAQKFIETLMNEPGAMKTTEVRYNCKHGSYKWIEFKCTNLLNDPDINGLLGNYSDITGRKLAEEALIHSEATITNKLKAITEPEGDISSLELSDIIDTEVLQSMMEDFYELTGMLGAVLDVSGKVLVAVGWQDICTKFHRCNPDTLRNCIESDSILSSGVPEGKFKSYHCKNNMWDIVTPIMVGGKHVGNVFMGQYLLEGEEPDYEFFRKQAQKYGFDEAAYIAALDRVPRFSEEIVDAGMRFYSTLAGVISTLSYSTIQQSRMLTQQKQTEIKTIKAKERAEQAEEKLKNTFDLSPSIICKANLETGYFIEANQAVTRILGYSVEEFTSKPFIELIHPDDQQKSTDEKDEQIKGKEVTFFENRYLCKDGAYKWIAWHGTKADQNGIVTAIGSDINERKMVEQEIVETKQFYENIIEGVQDGIWVTNENDVIYYANSGMEKIAGVPREKIQGKNILKDFPEDTAGEFNKFYKQAKKEKKPVWYLIKVTKPGNKITWENGWLIPQYQNNTFKGIICTIRDVTERIEAESSVRKLSTAVEQSPSMVVITNTEGKVEYINPAFTELTGYNSAEAIGQKSNILKSGEQDAAFYKEMWKTVDAGKVWRGQFHNKKKNGELFWEAASISAILNESGDVINFIKIGEDITDFKKAEDSLNAALVKAEESDRLKSAFLANMSHEIRTPMNGILGFTALLQEPNLADKDQQKYIDIIQKSGDRMLSTVNDIIDISRIESGQVVLSVSEVNISEKLKEFYSFFKHEAAKKGIQLIFKNDNSEQDINIKTDLEKFSSILTNLIKNAIKFTNKGTIEFGYDLTQKTGTVELEFYVKDSGIGIPKDRQKAIFDRFVQADIEDKQANQGSGLGLAISKAYAEMLDGKMWIESEVGKGSTFYFTIKCNSGAESKSHSTNDEQILNEDSIIGKLKILVAEDDETSQQLISIVVDKFAKEIIIVSSGLEAVEVCRSNPDIDLILMDIQLPSMNGYEATRQIRQFNKGVVILAQTAYALTGDKEKSIDMGCNDYISKPLNESELHELIKKYLTN